MDKYTVFCPSSGFMKPENEYWASQNKEARIASMQNLNRIERNYIIFKDFKILYDFMCNIFKELKTYIIVSIKS